MPTTFEEFNKWINVPKEGCIEFKEAKNQYQTEKAMGYCVAIANECGGKLILGVTNERPRKIVGSQAFNNIQDIQKKIFDRLGFRVDVEEANYLDKRVVIFHIPSRPRGLPYEYDGAYLMRCLVLKKVDHKIN
jgi:ATP-dependent DNA helicase RecG